MLTRLEHRAAQAGMPAPERATLAGRLRALFARAGSRERHITDPIERGYAARLLREATTRALERANCPASEVDLIIYCSVSRGWLEPSSAAGVQAAIGASNASCFDVLEACASWVRAIEVADALLRAGRYRNVLIVGVEAGMQDLILPPAGDPAIQAEHLAGFTLGEAATAMLVEADASDPPEIVLQSNGDVLDVCLIPLPGIAAFVEGDSMLPPAGRFVSHSERLFFRVISALIDVARPRIARMAPGEVDLFIFHSASSRAGEVLRRALGIPRERWLCPHAEFGNTVSMSMPVALNHAFETGRAKPGDRVCFLVGSAGITYGYGILTV